MSNAIVPGSLAAMVANHNMTLAESFMACRCIVLIDQSGSMGAADAPGGRTRYEAADDELARLQKRNPGRVAVISFSRTVRFCPGGVPFREGETTNMAAALRYVQLADGVAKIVLISDGEPDSAAETLAEASKFQHAIHTVYIGGEVDSYGGRAFLGQLAAATGGRALQSDAPGLLADKTEQLLLA